jgi:hypothetical protein
MALFVQVRSIWLPSNGVIALGALVGLAAPGVSTVVCWTLCTMAARRCEEAILNLSEDVRADRRAAPPISFCYPRSLGVRLARACVPLHRP